MSKSQQTSSPRRLTELLDADFLARLDALDVLSRKILQGKMRGERRSKRRGHSVEFADHRPYVAGDDMRFIDWNIYGRLEQLFLKLFIEEQDLTVHILIDSSTSMGVGEVSKDRFIRKLTAALGYVSLVNNNRLTVTSFAEGVTGQVGPTRGRRHLRELAEFLLTGHADGPSFFDDACRQLVSARTGSGVMIVLSDFLFKEGYDSPLRRLIGSHYDLYVIQVLSPDELTPTLGGDLKLVDAEDGDVAEVTISAAMLAYYKRTLNAYCNDLKGFCTRRGATYVLANSSDAVEGLVLNYLRRIGLLH